MSGVELFTVAKTAVTLGDVLAAGGTLMSAAGAARQADASAGAAQYNADLARRQGEAEEARRRREARRELGRMRAGIAKSGVTTEGTPLTVLSESAEMAEIDALSARWSAQTTAKLDESRAASARASKPLAVGASLLSGASRIGSRRFK
jgi:hypothetical protein